MSYFRDTAATLAQRSSENLVGVVLYIPMGGQSKVPWWSTSTFPNSAALEDWYNELVGAPLFYYYLAAFDKGRGAVPVSESIAPPKPGMPGFDNRTQWRPPPFNRPSDRPSISGASDDFVSHLHRTPGLVSHGVVLQNPGAPREQLIWAYEVRWLRGQPPPSLPPTIDGRVVRLVIVDEFPRAHVGAERGRGEAGDSRAFVLVTAFAKAVVVFGAFAIPAGLLLSKKHARKHLQEQKTEFRRLGLDWDKRARY